MNKHNTTPQHTNNTNTNTTHAHTLEKYPLWRLIFHMQKPRVSEHPWAVRRENCGVDSLGRGGAGPTTADGRLGLAGHVPPHTAKLRHTVWGKGGVCTADGFCASRCGCSQHTTASQKHPPQAAHTPHSTTTTTTTKHNSNTHPRTHISRIPWRTNPPHRVPPCGAAPKLTTTFSSHVPLIFEPVGVPILKGGARGNGEEAKRREAGTQERELLAAAAAAVAVRSRDTECGVVLFAFCVGR